MYNDMYETYDDEEFIYDYPYSFEEENKSYLKPKYHYDKMFYVGDTAYIDFVLPNYDNEEVLVTFTNFRGELIYSQSFVPNQVEEETITVLIDQDATQLFSAGTYKVNVKLIAEDYVNTVITGFSVYVK